MLSSNQREKELFRMLTCYWTCRLYKNVIMITFKPCCGYQELLLSLHFSWLCLKTFSDQSAESSYSENNHKNFLRFLLLKATLNVRGRLVEFQDCPVWSAKQFSRDSNFHIELLPNGRNIANGISVAPKYWFAYKIGSHIPRSWSQKERRDARFKCAFANTYLVGLIFP